MYLDRCGLDMTVQCYRYDTEILRSDSRASSPVTISASLDYRSDPRGFATVAVAG